MKYFTLKQKILRMAAYYGDAEDQHMAETLQECDDIHKIVTFLGYLGTKKHGQTKK